MKTTIRRAIMIIAVAVGLLAFVPSSAGGATNYVTVTGSSMSPTLKAGDMVMLTRHDQYAVGDVVAYRSQGLGGTMVIHRIIEIADDGRYVTKGDNNDFVDQYHPDDMDILGVQVASVSSDNPVRRFFTQPYGAAVVFGAVGLLFFLGSGTSGGRHHHHVRRGAGS